LTLPKLGVKKFKGIHYLGGRFIPENFKLKNKWEVPVYKGLD